MIRWKKILTLLALAIGASAAQAAIPPSERQVLIDLYNSTNGAGWVHREGWRNDTDTGFAAAGTECSWHGVTCDLIFAPTHVTQIHLADNLLSGVLPQIAALTKLQVFAVLANNLTGPLPEVIGLNELRELNVQFNQITGPIPSLAGLTKLEIVDANNNQLTGSIPPLAGLTALQTFLVYKNKLTGTIPSLADLPALKSFSVSNNQINGNPPAAPNGLAAGQSELCPNFLSTPSPNDPVWNAAVGSTWSNGCMAAPDYTITPIAGPNGTVTPPTPQSIRAGTTQAFIITANTGYVIDAVSGCDGTLSGSIYITAAAIEDCAVNAAFRVALNYTITPSAGPNGAIAPAAPQSVVEGTAQAFTITPTNGYAIDAVSGCNGTLSGSTFTTAAAVADCTVSATFKAAAAAVQGVAAIPTLGEWGLLLLGLLVAGAAALRIRRLTS